jgi:hypothetical protein
MNNSTPNDWRVEIVANGRDGYITYREDSDSAKFYWEVGGGDVLAIIHAGKPSMWSYKYPWAVDRRHELLERVSKEVIRQKAPTCTATFDDKTGEILLRRSFIS